jgi:nitrate reductase cytochrome c-type subunit
VRDADALARRLVLIALAMAAMFGIILFAALRPFLDGGAASPDGAVTIQAAAAPIAAEADVFRTQPGGILLGTTGATRGAHMRTLTSYRSRREYPGAPPRIPHGLTSQEYRSGECNTCHERGGYSQRFGTYIPVTPHPEWSQCLQCHASNAAIVGLQLPGSEPDATCRQCHVPASRRIALPALDWRAADWPRPRGAFAVTPPVVPHDLVLRGNCLACHMGPAAVTEVRTRHPERGNCRQCHVPANVGLPLFARPETASTTASGGWP